MTRDLFDRSLRAVRRDRAARLGPELFLLDRAMEDCLDNVRTIDRRFERALLIGCPSPDWPQRVRQGATDVDILDPGPLFAQAAGGLAIEEDRHDFGENRFDLVIAVGTLDTVNDLQAALRMIHRAMQENAPFIGAIAGGDSLATLRASLIEADRHDGRAVARTHPRIEAPTLAGLLSATGFSAPVVDVDRVRLRYHDLASLVGDLRSMGATSALAQRGPNLGKAAFHRAQAAFAAAAIEGKTGEVVEILHFIGWKQESRKAAD
jgi:NADH dehydrogenase [ubiquinone] 1 alpha subcomplex assembly factor 5